MKDIAGAIVVVGLAGASIICAMKGVEQGAYSWAFLSVLVLFFWGWSGKAS